MSELATAFNIDGMILTPGREGYEEARRLYNGMLDKRPAIIARCLKSADVSTAINYGRSHRMLIAIRGGGHNGGGLGSCDGGLVIDLSALKGVEVDPKARTARVAAGCTQGEVDQATHAYGLAVPAGIVSTTGISGLALGGGTGYLTRSYGLTADNLLGAELVLADGSEVTANKDENPDLLWALRGGGGNFGVVTSFLFRAHPVDQVYAGLILWDAVHAREIMCWYRDFLPTAPRELTPFLGLKTVPSCDPFPKVIRGRRICALISCFNGSEPEGRKAMEAASRGLPEPLLDSMGMMPFPVLQSMFDGLLPAGLQWYWRGAFVNELTDAAIDVHLEHAARAPSELSLMHLYPIDGVVHDLATDASAWSRRHARWSMVIAGITEDPAKASAIERWAKDYWAAVHPFSDGGGYVNFLMADEGDARVRAAYGQNYARLARIKAHYDPDNLFRVNQNILPQAAQVEARQMR